MSLVFHRLDVPLPPRMRVWGAVQGVHQFVLSHDQMHGCFAASVKKVPNATARVDLGQFAKRSAAVAACEKYLMGQA